MIKIQPSSLCVSVLVQVVSPLIFESIPGLYLFQGLLLSSVTNGVRLLEEIKHDSKSPIFA